MSEMEGPATEPFYYRGFRSWCCSGRLGVVLQMESVKEVFSLWQAASPPSRCLIGWVSF